MPVEIRHVEIQIADKVPNAVIVIVINPTYPKRSGFPILNVIRVWMIFEQAFEPIKWLEIPKIRAPCVA